MGEFAVGEDVEGRVQASQQTDWRDGFLFVGNQLSLDFVNTRPLLSAGPGAETDGRYEAKPKELLPDARALWRWMAAAGLLWVVDSAPADEDLQFGGGWAKAQDSWQDEMAELRSFREAYREVLLGLEAGIAAPDAFLGRLNGLLGEHPQRFCVVRGAERPCLQTAFRPQSPADAFAPLAASAAQILTAQDLGRLRQCDHCALQFVDTSKKGLRRWCSMRLCGNRLKVAAYARRKRLETGK